MSAIAIFVPCFIAGVRDEDVGRDIHAYVIPVMNRAINATSISSYISATSYVEIGYSLFICMVFTLIYYNEIKYCCRDYINSCLYA